MGRFLCLEGLSQSRCAGQLVPGRTLSVAYGDSSPEGRALGRTSKFRPHRSTAGRSLPISCKLFALAKASTFGGGGISQSEMTERVPSGRNLSVAYGDSSPKGRALGRTSRSRPHSLTAGRSLLLSCKLYASAKASTFGGGGISQSEMTEGVPSGRTLSVAYGDS